MRHSNGQYRWLSITYSLAYNFCEQAPAAVVGSARDITQRKLAEEQESRLQEKATRTEQVDTLRLFVGGVADELDDLLRSMVVLPRSILLKLQEDARLDRVRPLRQDVLALGRSVRRARDLVRDLMALSSGQTSRLQSLDLNGVLTEYLWGPEFYRLVAANPCITLKEDISSDFLRIRGSKSDLLRAFSNLIISALEAMQDGGQLTVSTATERVRTDFPAYGYEVAEEGEYAVVRVRGTNIGEEEVRRLYEPCDWAKLTEDHSETQLRLAIVHAVLKKHDGFVSVHSEKKKGTEFALYFPECRRPAGSPARRTRRRVLRE
jgi:signal transduction histidine kinase